MQYLKTAILALILVMVPFVVRASGLPSWAFSVPDKTQPREPKNNTLEHLPGSTKAYTLAQVNDLKNPPDWYPSEHAAMPIVVAHGGKGFVWACASCHLASGMGHPESAQLSGLSASYIEQQIAAFRNGRRRNSVMMKISNGLSDAETRAAARWFSHLRPFPWVIVKEVRTVPKTYVDDHMMRLPLRDVGTEPLGDRIIELPQNVMRERLRDPHSGTVAYVPKGSVFKGKELVTAGSGKVMKCDSCHGASEEGSANAPQIAGRSPVYVFRQLYDFKHRLRTGPSDTNMEMVVSNLTNDDMIDIAAYLATLKP